MQDLLKPSASLERYLSTAPRRIEGLQLRLQAASRRLSFWRVGVFLATLALVILWSELRLYPAMWFSLLGGSGGFVWLVRQHQAVRRQQVRAARAKQLRQADLGRLQRDWSQIPALPPEDSPGGHPFESDLDITGPHSLLRLLHTCLTVEGGERLKTWLLQREPDAARLQQRQQLVQALRHERPLRDALQLALAELAATYRQSVQQGPWRSAEVLEVLQQLPRRRPLAGLISLSALALVNMGLFAGATFGLIGNRAWQLSLLVYVIAFWLQRGAIQQLFAESQHLHYALQRLQQLFGVLERLAPSRNEPLRKALAPFSDPQTRPSQRLKSLGQIVAAAGLQGNLLLWAALHLLWPFDFYTAWRLERLKPQLQQDLPRWLDSFWELEALSALAHYAWLHPAAPFAELSPGHSGLQVQDLGHPLLPPDQKVRNSFALQQTGEGVLITGSNMAGKSTFLKSLGLNQVLAQAGTVVDASRYQAPLLRVVCCIRVSDSINDGLSYFYAEVTRLKVLLQAIEANHPLPVLFLVDEIFKGTNNRERLLGSRAYIQALTGKNALGGVSTHDLELVQLADSNPLLQNYHFREQIIDGQMVFDYTLRPGPCPTTNALRIMALAGLPVPDLPPEFSKAPTSKS